MRNQSEFQSIVLEIPRRDLAREWDNEYRVECWDLLWREYALPDGDGPAQVQAGYHLEQRKRANVLLFMISFAVEQHLGERIFLTPNEAKRQLWQYVGEEKLVANAVLIGTDGITCGDSPFIRGFKSALFASPTAIIQIPAYEWPHLDWWAHIDGEELLDAIGPMIGVKRYERVRLGRDDLMRCWPAERVRSPRGAKPKYDWGAIESETLRLMDYHGDFDPADPEWNAQARLEDALKRFCQTKWEREPVSGTLRPKLALWLKAWREKKAVGI